VDILLKTGIALETQKTSGQRLAEALELMDWGIRMKRQRLASQHPDLNPAQIEAMVAGWLSRDG
jgi:hypothetical protein